MSKRAVGSGGGRREQAAAAASSGGGNAAGYGAPSSPYLTSAAAICAVHRAWQLRGALQAMRTCCVGGV